MAKEPTSIRSDARITIFGVLISNLSQEAAVSLIEDLIRQRRGTRAIFIANSHTLNLASESPEYRVVLNGAYSVLADGTGVRWAARLRGVRLKANLVGTDLVPRLFEITGGKGYRYYLLGGDLSTVEAAAHAASTTYRGWDLAGFHHGYVAPEDAGEVVEEINDAHPDLLLVGMGNPRQEFWIHRHKAELRVPVCIGVGGLFDHWAGNLKRAPEWVRRQGLEWLQILAQQPHKWRRYLVGIPIFLVRLVLELPRDRRLEKRTGDSSGT